MSLAAVLLEKSPPSRSLLFAGVAVFVVSAGMYFVQRLDSASADVGVAMFDPRAVELGPLPCGPTGFSTVIRSRLPHTSMRPMMAPRT